MTSSAPTSFPKRKLGVTPARSFDGPLEADLHSTEELDQHLVELGLYKSKEEAARQEEVLGELDKVDEPGADIDTLCVGPKYVNREDFFTILCGILAQMEEVSELKPLPDAHFPAMKFKLHGISINLLYANVSLAVVPSDLDISLNSVLSGVDEVNLLSLSECRVADQILDLVPNIENFRTTLRCVKYWVKRRGVCVNAPGYLREVDCAVMVARMCQAYPNTVPSTLVTMFFSIFGEWYWPNPVMLCSIDEDRELGFPVWDARINRDDRSHIMPIITPAYPCRNSTVHVSASTLEAMKEQFQIGNEVCQEIEMKRADWVDLFEPLGDPPSDATAVSC